jgi:hypothetical protein
MLRSIVLFICLCVISPDPRVCMARSLTNGYSVRAEAPGRFPLSAPSAAVTLSGEQVTLGAPALSITLSGRNDANAWQTGGTATFRVGGMTTQTMNAGQTAFFTTRFPVLQQHGNGVTASVGFTPGAADPSSPTVRLYGIFEPAASPVNWYDLQGHYLAVLSSVTGERSFVLCLNNGAADRLAQDRWNLDRLDGTGPSGVNLATTAQQRGTRFTFTIRSESADFGRVRYGLTVNGACIWFHQATMTDTVWLPPMFYPVGAWALARVDGSGLIAPRISIAWDRPNMPTYVTAKGRLTAASSGVSGTFLPLMSLRPALDNVGADDTVVAWVVPTIVSVTNTHATVSAIVVLALNPVLTDATFTYADSSYLNDARAFTEVDTDATAVSIVSAAGLFAPSCLHVRRFAVGPGETMRVNVHDFFLHRPMWQRASSLDVLSVVATVPGATAATLIPSVEYEVYAAVVPFDS